MMRVPVAVASDFGSGSLSIGPSTSPRANAIRCNCEGCGIVNSEVVLLCPYWPSVAVEETSFLVGSGSLSPSGQAPAHARTLSGATARGVVL